MAINFIDSKIVYFDKSQGKWLQTDPTTDRINHLSTAIEVDKVDSNGTFRYMLVFVGLSPSALTKKIPYNIELWVKIQSGQFEKMEKGNLLSSVIEDSLYVDLSSGSPVWISEEDAYEDDKGEEILNNGVSYEPKKYANEIFAYVEEGVNFSYSPKRYPKLLRENVYSELNFFSSMMGLGDNGMFNFMNATMWNRAQLYL